MEQIPNMNDIENAQVELCRFLINMIPVEWSRICFYAVCEDKKLTFWFANSEKETGAITYTVYYYCEGKKIREVEKECFIPEPEVTSEVIKLNLREKPIIEIKDKKVMFNIIKSAYMQRRKTLINALTSVGIFKNKEQGIKSLKKLGLREDIRAENLTIEDFAKLTNLFIEDIKK